MFNKIFFICLILAIGKSNCIELENICDTFKHNGDSLTVNSVYKMKFDLPIKKITNFLIDEDISFENMFSIPHIAQLMNYYRTKNNKLVNEVYNENFLNSSENVKKIHKYSTKVRKNQREVKSFVFYVDPDKSHEFDNTIKKLINTDRLFFMILFLQDNIFNYDDNEGLELFKNLISNLKKSIGSDQKFVFENETLDYIRKNVKIFSFTKFTKHNSNQSTSTLTLQVYLPFYNPKYVKSDNCLSVKNLPKFYHMN